MEFPSDNPELWRLRAPLTALALLVAETPSIDDASDVIEDEAPEPAVALVAPDPIEEAPPMIAVALAEPVAVALAEPVVIAEVIAVAEVALAPAPEVDAPDAEPDVEVIEFDESDFAVIENESIPPPAMPDLFQVYVRTLVEVALAAGAPGRVVEILPGMVGLARLDTRALEGDAIDSLVSAGLLARTESGAVTRSDAFVAAAQAWRATLLGEEADFSACSTMLDEWSAMLIATLAGTPAQKESLRLQLRARGVAAFGLLVDAA